MDQKKNITKIIESNTNFFENVQKQILDQFGITSFENNPDILVIKPREKNSIGIEEMREVRSWAFIKPFNSKFKLCFIHSADLLTNEAQNSLLKITEEPPIFTYLHLIVESHKNMLPTIISRSEVQILKGEEEVTNLKEADEFLSASTLERYKLSEKLSKRNVSYLNIFFNDLISALRKKNQLNLIEVVLDLKKKLNANVSKKIIMSYLRNQIDKLN